MSVRKASLKETGVELSETEWQRFDEAVAAVKAERAESGVAANAPPLAAPDAADDPEAGSPAATNGDISRSIAETDASTP